MMLQMAQDAEKLKLKFVQNIYGDSINALDCRSIWIDEYGNEYRCQQLFDNKKYIKDENSDN